MAEDSGALAERETEFISKIKSIFSGSANARAAGILKQTRWLYAIGLAIILWVGWYVRTRNLPYLAGKYLVELDSYFFFRYAKMIYETGGLPAIDYARYVPLGYITQPYKFFSYALAYTYKFVHLFFPNLQQIQWHIYYPPVITLIAFVFFFLFAKELFGKRAALISTAFLAVIPAYIQRTSAGFADHEAMAMLWMFISLWFFVKMWKAEALPKAILFGALSGAFAGLMAMTWGGYRLLFLAISIYFVAAYLFFNLPKVRIFGYAAYVVVALAFLKIYSQQNFIISYGDGSLMMVFGIAIGAAFIAAQKLNIRAGFIPLRFLIIIAALLAGMAYTQATSFINWFGLLSNLNSPVSAQRFGSTVAESQIPSIQVWWQNFGLMLVLGFAALIAASFAIFYSGAVQITKNKTAFISALIAALFITIFYVAHQNRAGFLSKTFFNWFFLIFLGFVLLAVYKQKTSGDIENNKWVYLFLLTLLLVSFSTSRVQLRAMIALVPAIALATGFLISSAWGLAGKLKHRNMQGIVLIVLLVISVYGLNWGYQNSLAHNRGVMSMIPGQWESAMDFLREKTPKDSVVTHWWDYGHMTITLGERRAVTDGGNVRSWNYASGRFFLTGKDAASTLTYLKTHEVTHVLISDQEMPKYPAFSLIGSDANYDRYSSIGTFALQDVREARNGTLYLYGGGWGIDNNVVLGNLILPAGQASISGFSMANINGTLQEPKAYVSYSGKQLTFDLACVYVKGQRLNFPKTQNTMNGCLVIIPLYVDTTKGREDGGALWASEKVWDTNFARLYLYGEKDPNFELVYADNVPLAIFQGRTVGPIKIWEVNYPDWIKPDPEYIREISV